MQSFDSEQHWAHDVAELRHQALQLLSEGDLDAAESLLWIKGRRLLASILVDLLGSIEESLPAPRCGECGRPMTAKGYRPRHLVTLLGPVRIMRRYFICQTDHTCSAPLDMLLHLSRSPFTNSVRLIATALGSALPVREVARLMQEVLQVDIASTSIARHARTRRMKTYRTDVDLDGRTHGINKPQRHTGVDRPSRH